MALSSERAGLLSHLTATIHTKLYSRQVLCSPFTQSCTHVRCLVHHSHKALLTCSIPFCTTIHTKLCSVEVPCPVQPLTQSCIQLRYHVQHYNSHKAVFTCGILFITTIHTKMYSLAVSCSAPPSTQSCVHFPLPQSSARLPAVIWQFSPDPSPDPFCQTYRVP